MRLEPMKTRVLSTPRLHEASNPANPIVQRDDGLWSIGWHDDADGPFESRLFALAVAASQPLHTKAANNRS
jgi:hypothetical protein